MCVNAFLSVLNKDPWMFGLVPEDLENFPAAPGSSLPEYSRSAADVDEDIDWNLEDLVA